jgi:hypothetical protein
MPNSTIMAAVFTAAVALAASAAYAQPYGKGGNYALKPPARPATQAAPKSQRLPGDCDCLMMRGDGAMREMCMTMMPDRQDGAPKR